MTAAQTASSPRLALSSWSTGPAGRCPKRWPSPGYGVVVRGGPGPEDYIACEVVDGEVVDGGWGAAGAGRIV